jgi:hypothetical protein
MTRRDTWWRRGRRLAALLLGGLLVGCLGLALVLAVCLPWLLEQAIARELARRGLGSITIGVQAISWDQATLGPVAISGEDGVVRATSVVLRYQPARLRHYQVDAVEVVGLRLRLTRRDGTWVPSAQATLRRALAEALRMLPAGGAPSAYPTLTVRSSQLELEAAGEVVSLPFEGTAHLAGTGPSRVQAVAWVCGAPVVAQTVFALETGTGTATVDCQRLDLGAWLQAAARVGIPVPDALVGASGTAALRAQLELSNYACSGLDAEAVISNLEVPGEAFPLRLRTAIVAVQAGPDLRRPRVTFTVDSEAIAVGTRVVEPFRCHGSWHDDTLECAIDTIDVRLGSLVQGTAQLRLTAQGLTAPATAWLDLHLDVSRLDTAPLGSWTGRARAVGMLGDLWVNATFDASPAGNRLGVQAVSLDGRIQRQTAGLEAMVAATLSVLPEVAVATLGAGLQVSSATLPLELTAALALPSAAPWHGSGTFALPARRLALTAPGVQAAAVLGGNGQLTADARGVTVAGRVAASALTADVRGATLAADTLTVRLDALHCAWPQTTTPAAAPDGTTPPARPQVEGQCELRGGNLRLANGLQCSAINLDLPLAWSPADGLREGSDQAAEGGRLSTGPIAFGAFAASGLQGRSTAVGQTLRLEGELVCTAPAVTIGFTQSLDWSNGLALALHYVVPPLPIQGDESWYPRLPALKGLCLAGTLAVEGDVVLDRQGLRTPCRVRLSDGELTWPQQKLTVKGLEADLRFEDALQARTAPFQALRFTAATVQDVIIDGGQLVFAADGPESFSLLRCELNWCGGQVHTQALQLNPRNLDFDLVLFAENVDFISALNLVKGFKAKGNGVLNGKLPISYHNGRLTYANGYLYSVPGQPGSLRLQSNGWLTSAVPADNPAFGELQQAEKALEDFRLDVFRLEFTGQQAGTPGAKINLTGQGNNGKVPVTLDLNLNGPIEEVINVGLRLGGM